ncbi:MAG: MBL fold metallo-hydrolase [Eubacteriales bacterium]
MLIKEENCILVDTALSGDGPEILRAIEKTGLNLKYIIITHAHYDHAGSLGVVQKATGVPVICSTYEMPHLKSGETSVIQPQGVTMADLVKSIGLSDKDTQRLEATNAEYIAFDDVFDLRTLGFDGYIKVLAGHTPGSACVFTPEDIICGDTVFNVSPRHFPPIYSDKAALIETFHFLKNSGCRYIYPAHGKRMRLSELKLDWPENE